MTLVWGAQAGVTVAWSVSSYDADDQRRLPVTFGLAVTNLTFILLVVLLYFAFMCFSFWLMRVESKEKKIGARVRGDIEMK